MTTTKVCVAEPGCNRTVVARQMCMYHYNRWRRPDPVVPSTKTCSRCSETKPSDAFQPRKNAADGLRPWCQECVQEDNRNRMRMRRYGTVDLGLEPRHCIVCDVEFTPWRRDQVHCSKTACGAWSGSLRRNFGITPTEYKAMLDAQGGGCDICGTRPSANGKRLAVDHDHKTGVVRAILCQRCNMVLGMVEDDPTLLTRMIGYLNR